MVNPVEQYYDQKVLNEWQRLERHPVEFGVTMLALADFLPPSPATIADIGGGPGRYAIALAQQGYQITLIDLSQRNLEMAQEKAKLSQVSIDAFVQANALDLSDFASSSFDAVLMLGPLYHLLTHDERLRAVQEALRLLKVNGRLFAAFITRFAQVRYAAKFEPEWLVREQDYTVQFMATGIHRNHRLFTDAYFAHPDEIAPFMESAGFVTVQMVGCEGVVARIEEKVNELEGEELAYWVELNYRLGQEPSLYGASDHLLYIGQKAA